MSDSYHLALPPVKIWVGQDAEEFLAVRLHIRGRLRNDQQVTCPARRHQRELNFPAMKLGLTDFDARPALGLMQPQQGRAIAQLIYLAQIPADYPLRVRVERIVRQRVEVLRHEHGVAVPKLASAPIDIAGHVRHDVSGPAVLAVVAVVVDKDIEDGEARPDVGIRAKRIGNGGERPADDGAQRFLRRRLFRLGHDQAVTRRGVGHGIRNQATGGPLQHAVGFKSKGGNVLEAGFACQAQGLLGVLDTSLHWIEIPLVPLSHVTRDDIAAEIGFAETGLRPQVVVVEHIEPPVVVVEDRIIRPDSFEMDALFIDRVLRADGKGRAARSGKDGAGEKCQKVDSIYDGYLSGPNGY